MGSALALALAVGMGTGLALALGAAGCAGRSPFAAPPRLPAEFPDDVSPYPGGILIEAQSLPAGALMATWETSDGLDAVWQFYREDLRARGWSGVREKRPKPKRGSQTGSAPGAQLAKAASPEPADPPEAAQRMIIAQKGPRSATLLIWREGETSTIELMLVQDETR
jgi:hypothetical protein